MRTTAPYHPIEAEALACFELKLGIVVETYFRALRGRLVGLVERDGTLPFTFWMSERDSLARLLVPLYEAGLRLGMELERPPYTALNTFINLNTHLQSTVNDLARETAQEITLMAARQVGELLNMGLNPQGLPDRLRDELRTGILSDSTADQSTCYQTARIIAVGRLMARRPQVIHEWLIEDESIPEAACI